MSLWLSSLQLGLVKCRGGIFGAVVRVCYISFLVCDMLLADVFLGLVSCCLTEL